MHRIYIDLQLINIFQRAVLFLVTFWVILFFEISSTKNCLSLPIGQDIIEFISQMFNCWGMGSPSGPTPVFWGVKKPGLHLRWVFRAKTKKVFKRGICSELVETCPVWDSYLHLDGWTMCIIIIIIIIINYHYYYIIIHNYPNICAAMVWTCPGLEIRRNPKNTFFGITKILCLGPRWALHKFFQEEDKKARKAFEEELELDDEGVTCQILIHHIFCLNDSLIANKWLWLRDLVLDRKS